MKSEALKKLKTTNLEEAYEFVDRVRMQSEQCGLHEVSRFIQQKLPHYYIIIDETRKLGDVIMKDKYGDERVERFVAGLYQIVKNVIESVWQPKSQGTEQMMTSTDDNHLVCLQALGENAVRFYTQYKQPGWTMKDGISFVLTAAQDVLVRKCRLNAYNDTLKNLSRDSCASAVSKIYAKISAKDASWLSLSMQLGDMYSEVTTSCGAEKSRDKREDL